MKKGIQNIAIVLLFIIAYPFVFQAAHILSHDHGHSHTHSLNPVSGNLHECPRHDGRLDASGTGFDGLNDYEYSAGRQLSILQQYDNTGKHCPLCEHDFAKFKIDAIFQIATSGERFASVNSDLHQNPPVLYTGNNASLRAPPLNNY